MEQSSQHELAASGEVIDGSTLRVVRRVLKQSVQRAVLATPAWKLFEPGFVIVGPGHSGTRYTAMLLQAAGIRCGHETWWTLTGTKPRSLRLQGDSSWVATFQLDTYTGKILHQVRDPLKVINSFVRYTPKPPPPGDGPRRSDFFEETGDRLVDALQIVVTWVHKAEEIAEWDYRVEDIDTELLLEICERIGHPVSRDVAVAALEAVSTKTNQHVSDTEGRLRWEEIPDMPLKSQAMAISERYGYL